MAANNLDGHSYITLKEAIKEVGITIAAPSEEDRKAFYRLAQEHSFNIVLPLSKTARVLQKPVSWLFPVDDIPHRDVDIDRSRFNHFTLVTSELVNICHGVSEVSDSVSSFASINFNEETCKILLIPYKSVIEREKPDGFNGDTIHFRGSIGYRIEGEPRKSLLEFNDDHVFILKQELDNYRENAITSLEESSDYGDYQINAWSNKYIVDLNIAHKEFFDNNQKAQDQELMRTWFEKRWEKMQPTKDLLNVAPKVIDPNGYSEKDVPGGLINDDTRGRNQKSASNALMLVDQVAMEKYQKLDGFEKNFSLKDTLKNRGVKPFVFMNALFTIVKDI